MSELVDAVGLSPTIRKCGFVDEIADFEWFYDDFVVSGRLPELRREIERRIHDYFSSMKLPDTVTLYGYLFFSRCVKKTSSPLSTGTLSWRKRTVAPEGLRSSRESCFCTEMWR